MSLISQSRSSKRDFTRAIWLLSTYVEGATHAKREDPLSIYTATLDTVIHDTPWAPARSHFSLHKPSSGVFNIFPPVACWRWVSTQRIHITAQTQGEVQHVLNIFFGVLGDYLKTLGLCPRLKPSLQPAPQSSITSSLSQYTQSLLYPSSALHLLGFYHYHPDPSSLHYFSHLTDLTCWHIDNVLQ